MKKILIGILVVALAVGGYFLYTRYQQGQAAAASNYQFVKVSKGDLTATVGATGTVRANQTAILNWQTSGIVQKINVQEGDQVKANDVIATLDPTSLPQNIILAQADLVNAQRNLTSLQDSETARAQAQLALTQAQAAYDKANTHREGLKYPRASQTNIDNAWTQYQFALSQVAQAQNAYDRTVNLPNDNILKIQALGNLTSAQKSRDQALANYNWMTGKPTEEDISDADAKLAVAQAQLQDAQREWDRLKNGPDPQDIGAAQARVDAIQATLNMARLTTPFAGTITDLHMKPGDLVSPSGAAQALATTPSSGVRVDDLTHLLVDVQVTEVDINRIAIGQPVSMSFDAILGQEYNGNVIQVARSGTASGGVVNFTVTVEITNADDSVKPGMTAAINVVVNQLNGVLTVPNRAIRLRDGQRVVYLLKNGVPTAVNITIGASSDTLSQVVSGDVKAGDEVILNPPTEFIGGAGAPFGR